MIKSELKSIKEELMIKNTVLQNYTSGNPKIFSGTN